MTYIRITLRVSKTSVYKYKNRITLNKEQKPPATSDFWIPFLTEKQMIEKANITQMEDLGPGFPALMQELRSVSLLC